MTTLPHDSRWYAIDDAKIAVLTADPAGDTPTYATAIDVPGVKSVGISGDINSTELRGDGRRIDQFSKLTGLSLTFEFAKASLDIFSALAGGAVTDTGAAGSEVATWELGADDGMSYFLFEGLTKGVDTIGGDGTLRLWKCVLTSFPSLGFADEDYQTFSVDAAAMPLTSTGQTLTGRLRAVTAPISVA
jgi:hypothetical protein